MTKKHPHANPAAEPAPVVPEPVEAPADIPVAEFAPPEPDPLADLQAQVADLTEKFLRSRADFDNYRKRMQRDLQEIRVQERHSVIRDFIAVLDHFQMAQVEVDKGGDLGTIRLGFSMILQQFKTVLGGFGVTTLDVTGQPFDPRTQEAVSQEASDTVPAGTVLRQWKAGYKVGETLLRPAIVVVSSGPATASETAS